jgi:hypothetical protein
MMEERSAVASEQETGMKDKILVVISLALSLLLVFLGWRLLKPPQYACWQTARAIDLTKNCSLLQLKGPLP